jgi:hypothetical protein
MDDIGNSVPGWGRDLGFIEVAPRLKMDSAAILRRIDIEDTIRRCAWSFDQCDLESLSSLFAADAVWEGSIGGHIPLGPFIGRDIVISWLGDFMASLSDQRRHNFTNFSLRRIRYGPGSDSRILNFDIVRRRRGFGCVHWLLPDHPGARRRPLDDL